MARFVALRYTLVARFTALCVRFAALCARFTTLCARFTALCVRFTALCGSFSCSVMYADGLFYGFVWLVFLLCDVRVWLILRFGAAGL